MSLTRRLQLFVVGPLLLTTLTVAALVGREELPRESLEEIVGVLSGAVLGVAVAQQLLGRRVEHAQDQLQHLLRGTDEGIFFFDATGTLSSQRSEALDELLPGSSGDTELAQLLQRYVDIPTQTVATCLQLLWMPEEGGFYSPFDATVNLLPSELRLAGHKTVRLQYKAGHGADGKLLRVYVIARDITEQLQSERAARAQQERADRISLAAASPEAFLAFQQEIGSLFDEIARALHWVPIQVDILKRHLHTLKGSTATSAFHATARRAHDLEDYLEAIGPDASFREALRTGREQWEAEVQDVRQVLGLNMTTELRRVSVRKLAALVAEVRARRDDLLLERVEDLERRPIAELLERHCRSVLELVSRREQPVPHVLFDEDSEELLSTEVEGVDAILAHILRNTVDHGLEPAHVRAAMGKAPEGTIRIGCRRDGSHRIWSIADDGRGIPGEMLARKMVATGGWDEDQAMEASWEEKVSLALHPGLSTMNAVTETSGRGIGLDAVQKHVEDMGGELHLWAQPGRGTTVMLIFPIERSTAAA